MNNPINGVGRGRGPIATETSSVNGAQKPAASQPSKAGNGGADLVSLTNTASSLQQLQKQMASEAPVDAAKVSAIKDALHSQQYEIDAERVAEKFIEVEQALGKV
jgi:negative regulator of flagellin synthesis FlgM